MQLCPQGWACAHTFRGGPHPSRKAQSHAPPPPAHTRPCHTRSTHTAIHTQLSRTPGRPLTPPSPGIFPPTLSPPPSLRSATSAAAAGTAHSAPSPWYRRSRRRHAPAATRPPPTARLCGRPTSGCVCVCVCVRVCVCACVCVPVHACVCSLWFKRWHVWVCVAYEMRAMRGCVLCASLRRDGKRPQSNAPSAFTDDRLIPTPHRTPSFTSTCRRLSSLSQPLTSLFPLFATPHLSFHPPPPLSTPRSARSGSGTRCGARPPSPCRRTGGCLHTLAHT
jgi:hypothetical protein